MKKGVVIAIIVGVIALAVAGFAVFFFLNDATQKVKIMEEFSEIGEMAKKEDFSKEMLDEKTNTVVTEGKYATVEKAAKKYASEFFDVAFKIKETMEDEKMLNILTAENYQNDGPEFAETKAYLADMEKKIEDYRTEMFSFLEENKINSYIENETNDKSSRDLYKQLVTEDIQMSETEKEELETAMNKVKSLLEIANEVIDFLKENQGNWQVQGEQVAFVNNQLITKYNSFLSKLQSLQ